jgi:hypothetical protein
MTTAASKIEQLTFPSLGKDNHEDTKSTKREGELFVVSSPILRALRVFVVKGFFLNSVSP